jgi:hypothetical protein
LAIDTEYIQLKYPTGPKSCVKFDSKKDNREEDEKEREEAKKRILKEDPNIAKDTLEFMLSLPVERKVPKVTELETVYATAEQQQEMERLLLKKNDKKE